MRKIILFKVLFLASLTLSSSVFAQQNLQDKSSVEMQAVQTRIYQKPYKQVFHAVRNVLLDNKYKIFSTDMGAGAITAMGNPQTTENMPKALGLIPYVGILFDLGHERKTEMWQLNVSVEDLEQNRGVLVRLTINSDQHTSNIIGGGGTTDDLTSKPEIYQDLFAKIEKTMFIRDAVIGVVAQPDNIPINTAP